MSLLRLEMIFWDSRHSIIAQTLLCHLRSLGTIKTNYLIFLTIGPIAASNLVSKLGGGMADRCINRVILDICITKFNLKWPLCTQFKSNKDHIVQLGRPSLIADNLEKNNTLATMSIQKMVKID